MSINILHFRAQPPTTKRVLEVGVSGGIIGRYMTSHNWAGTTIPFPFLVIIFYWQADNTAFMPYCRVHEFTHVAQDEADRWWFVAWAKYGWQMVKNFAYRKVLKRQETISDAAFQDYMANKYEQEAYAVEDEAYAKGLPDWAKP
jgi:hypothetical protein